MTLKEIIRVVIFLGMHTALSCSQTVPQKETTSNQSEVLGTHYATIVFDEGDSSLSPDNIQGLKELTKRAFQRGRPISEVKILAWSDKEYPENEHDKPDTQDIILASERARNIREFLKQDYKVNFDIDSFNMAKRPGMLSKLLKNENFSLKESIEQSGTTGLKLPDGSVSYTKASKALVILDDTGNKL